MLDLPHLKAARSYDIFLTAITFKVLYLNFLDSSQAFC